MKQYSTNLTDKQWQVIEKIINLQERKRKHSLRNIMNAILYLLKTGCQWRMIPRNFAPRESVYYYFSKWSNEGIIERLSYKFPRLAKILADGGYRGSLADWVFNKFKWELEVVLRPDECPSKFKIIPKRWIVERAFAWLENFRRCDWSNFGYFSVLFHISQHSNHIFRIGYVSQHNKRCMIIVYHLTGVVQLFGSGRRHDLFHASTRSRNQ